MLLSSPLLIVTTIWLHFANKGAGAWFLQERPGLHGKLFKIIKFKTMTDERDAEGNLLPDEARLTKIGKIVRKTTQYLPLYSPEQARRHEVRPEAYRVGRNVMGAITSVGRRSSSSMSGMWIMYP